MNRPSLSKTALAGAVLAASFATAACRGGGGGDDIDGGGDAVNGDMRIQDVQNDAMAAGTAVTLKGVVVVAIDNYGGRRGNFYVMEPEGGEYSGILVYGAPLDQVAALAVGDLVDISDAEKDEFSLADDDATVTELVPISGGQMTVTRTGTGTVPAPHVVDSLTFGRMDKAAREAEYEKWEGVLIRVDNVSVISGLRQIGSSDPDFRGFGITGLYEVDSSLAEIPVDHVLSGDCLMSVTGMGDYFYEYKVLPRTTADIVKDGTACPPPESAAQCDDQMDNDANGYADCMDNACLGEAICQSSATVVNIQNGTVATSSVVNLANVVVTAIGSGASPRNIWVADDLAAAPYNGLQVYRGSTPGALPAGVEVGARVNITGRVVEFNDTSNIGLSLTELSNIPGMSGTPVITFVSAPAGAPTALQGVSLADLTTDPTTQMPYGNAEQYEGVLVEIQNVKVTGAADGFGQRSFAAAGGVSFISVSDISSLSDPTNTCYTLIRGVWTFQVNYNSNVGSWAIAPLGGAGNTTIDGTGAACPF